MPVAAPRNMKQLRNLRHHSLHSQRLSRDDILNLHEMAYELNGYIHWINTYPDLEVVFGMKELLQELDNILVMRESGEMLSYDTTFNLGDFYLSCLIFKHTAFKGNPCIPGMFLVHERKFTATHRVIFDTLKKNVPSLSRTQVPIAIDQEKAIVSAVHTELPQMPVVHCWNHILQDICRWLKAHNAPSEDIACYMDHVRQLLHQPHEQAYVDLLEQHKKVWDQTFTEYYTKNVHRLVPQSLGRWQLEALGVYNPYSGVTTNQSESMNRVIKDLQSWKEAPVDVMVMSLYQLQSYYFNEVQRGLCGLGEYQLKESHSSLAREVGEIDLLHCEAPDDIVRLLREKGVQETPLSITQSATTSATTMGMYTTHTHIRTLHPYVTYVDTSTSATQQDSTNDIIQQSESPYSEC